jgi:TMEM175 potassium channel family protein
MPADAFDSPGPGAPAPGTAPSAGDLDEAGDQRLLTLSDGVVAIALTLLILGIQVPSPDSLRDPDSVSALAGALSHTVDGWIGYLIAFYAITQFWLVHRHFFRGVRGDRDGVAAWNFLFLFTITVMPFTSDLLGKYPENPLSVIIFSANLVLATLARFGMLWFVRRHHLLDVQDTPARAQFGSIQGIVNIFFYVLAMLVALASPDLAKFCWLGLALSPKISMLITRHREVRRAG